MSEDFNDNKTIQAQSSETISGEGVRGVAPDKDYDNWLQQQETFSDLVAKQQEIKLSETKLAKK